MLGVSLPAAVILLAANVPLERTIDVTASRFRFDHDTFAVQRAELTQAEQVLETSPCLSSQSGTSDGA